VLFAASVGLGLGRCCSRRVWGWGLCGAVRGECGAGACAVLLAASVGIALSPSASVVVLLKSDFLAYYY